MAIIWLHKNKRKMPNMLSLILQIKYSVFFLVKYSYYHHVHTTKLKKKAWEQKCPPFRYTLIIIAHRKWIPSPKVKSRLNVIFTIFFQENPQTYRLVFVYVESPCQYMKYDFLALSTHWKKAKLEVKINRNVHTYWFDWNALNKWMENKNRTRTTTPTNELDFLLCCCCSIGSGGNMKTKQN